MYINGNVWMLLKSLALEKKEWEKLENIHCKRYDTWVCVNSLKNVYIFIISIWNVNIKWMLIFTRIFI